MKGKFELKNDKLVIEINLDQENNTKKIKDKVFNIKQASKYSGLKENTIVNYFYLGRLKPYKGLSSIKKKELDRYLKKIS